MRPDLLLQRLGRTAIVVCLLMAAVALFVFGPFPRRPAYWVGTVDGTSFYLLASGTGGLATLISGDVTRAEKRQIAARVVLKLAGRYSLLGFFAYVMIARLRLHPLGLLAGASSVAGAAFVEAVALPQ